ncbi:MAG: hypothetical protein JJ975_15020 [Bacteroidia bacterium]|nr:hypothetical protein [Bacteroidia bacterium]
MESEKIISFLENYKTIGHSELLEITELQKKYPWFSLLYGLESKCLKNENKFGVKKAIKKASLYAGNREILYDLIHDELQIAPTPVTEVLTTPIETEPELLAVETTDTHYSPPEEVIIEDKTEATEEPTVETDERIEVVEEVTQEIQEEEVVYSEKEVVEVEEDEPETTEEIVEDKVEAQEEPSDVERDEQIEVVTDAPLAYDPLVELQKFIPENEDESEKNVDVSPEVTPTYDPLVELPKLDQPKEPKEKQDFFAWLDSYAEEEKEEAKPRKLRMSKEASELLENFIKNRPKISRIRQDVDRLDVYNPVRESAENELVTESLAKLHLKQNNPENAIEIYEKLSLQNPKKLAYFAGLIEKIKKDHNLE